MRNLQRGLADRVHFVKHWQDCDIYFITGVTITDPAEVHEAHKAGKFVVLRVDNVPRKSRNRRQSPHERMKEFAQLADVVIYQSKWAEQYCKVLCGEGTVIYNGVDQSIFKPNKEISNDLRKNRYLFMYHGKNEHKGFWTAHYEFQMIARKNPNAEFWFVYDFGKDTQELVTANFDFWNGEKFQHLPRVETAQEVAEIMQQCGNLIYPSICDASPNVVLEARACGLGILGFPDGSMSGTKELVELDDISLERMCDEYYGVFSLLTREGQ